MSNELKNWLKIKTLQQAEQRHIIHGGIGNARDDIMEQFRKPLL